MYIRHWKLDIRNFGRIRNGFTLIELLVVIAIIGILATILMANFVGIKARARDAQRKSDIKQIQAALEFYRSDNGGYPTNLPSCGDPLTSPSGTKYITQTPCDPSDPTSTQYFSDFTNQFTNGAGVTVSRNYCLRTCLENPNDAQANSTTCNGSCGSGNYGVTNP